MPESDLGKFLYVSSRLVSSVIRAEESDPRPGFGVKKVTAKTKHLDIETAPNEEPDTDERRAIRATRLLEARTGTLLEPGKHYLRMRLDAYLARYSVHLGWENASNEPIAGISASQVVEGAGRVFVALFGSISNYRISAEESRFVSGWHPSDMNGLYSIFDAVREDGDAAPKEDRLAYDRKMSDREIVRAAGSILFGNHALPPIRRVEILAERFARPVRDIVIDHDHARYDLAVVGAPLWIREVLTEEAGDPAPPLTDRLGEFAYPFDDMRRAWVDESERVLILSNRVNELEYRVNTRTRWPDHSRTIPGESQLERQRQELGDLRSRLEAARSVLDETLGKARILVTSPEAFQELCSWFCRQAQHQGIPAMALSVYRRPAWAYRLFHRDWRSRLSPVETDIVGYTIQHDAAHKRGRDEVLITPAGEVFPVHISSYIDDPHAPVVYWPRDREARALGRDERPRPTSDHDDTLAVEMFQLAYLWRRGLRRDNAPETPWTSAEFVADMMAEWEPRNY